ncbi:Transcription elongation factor B polypeptide 3 [Triticum urartu]|uniref:Transcription elongation factor B polypeptide 3 n=1 Tax=Triticum urartu TaxID=4572 RepID=M7YVB7_TRIUA|nr:Transcription elongation factor B polypeptide 3 [Triticum urartu]
MEPGRKPLSLLDLCIRSAVDNLRTLNSVDIVPDELLKRILPHCTLEQLRHIESCTHADLTDVTDVLWKRFFQREFGEENMNLAIKRMKENGVRYKWKKLFEARTEKQKQVEARMSAGLKNKYQAANAGSGSSSLANSSYKSPILKKARMEVDSRAKMQAAIQRNTVARGANNICTKHFFKIRFNQIIEMHELRKIVILMRNPVIMAHDELTTNNCHLELSCQLILQEQFSSPFVLPADTLTSEASEYLI